MKSSQSSDEIVAAISRFAYPLKNKPIADSFEPAIIPKMEKNMDQNNNSHVSEAEEQIVTETPKEKEFKINKKHLIIGIAAVLLVAIAVTVCIILVNRNKDDGNDNTPPAEPTSVDILDGDLSAFVSIDAKYYKDYKVEIDKSLINLLTNSEIIKARYKHRSAEPVEGDGIISVGDEVNIFYKGYYLNGEDKVYFDGGSNMNGSSYKLGIGSGGFIPGFEYNMIGKNPADYSEQNPMIIKTDFPANYSNSTELAGKIAYFEVFVEKKDGKYVMTEYDIPALDDAFILEKLELTEGKLSSYEGETLAEKYFSYVRDENIKKGEMNQDNLALEAFWKSVLAGAVIKAYPEVQLKQAYDDMMNSVVSYYNAYYSSYYTLDEFACLYFGLKSGSDWKAEIDALAKEEIKQQLVFYHIMNLEGTKPTKEEYDAKFDEYLVKVLDEADMTEDKFDTPEQYAAMKESKKAELISSKGEEYFKAMIYYEIGVKAAISYAEIIEING